MGRFEARARGLLSTPVVMNRSTSGGPFGKVELLPESHVDAGINYSIGMSAIFVEYWFVFVGAAALYLPLVYLGQRYMKTREPVGGLKWILFTWNMFLSILSAYMFYRCFENGYALRVFRELPLMEAICRNRHSGLDEGATWTFNWMGYTKVLELVDTLFLVIRKKPVITLHWFHHLTVLLYVWGAHVFAATNSYLVFTVMNTFVHICMYFYFAMASIRIFFPFPHILTAMQILQMVVGSVTVYYSWYCPEQYHMWWAGMTMYVSYFVLFSKFFYDKYTAAPLADKLKKKKK